MNPIEIITEIKDALIRTENTGTVDPAILADIEKLVDLIDGIKTDYASKRDSFAFFFYNVLSIVDYLLGQMEKRLSDRETPGNISKTAEDSLAVLPSIRDIFEVTQSRETYSTEAYDIIEKTGELEDAANKRNLLPENLKFCKEFLDSRGECIMQAQEDHYRI